MLQPDEDMLTSCDFFMPAIESMEFGDVALVLDVSGSLSHKSKQLASEVFHCLSLLGKKTLDTVYVSNRINHFVTIESSDDIKRISGGGTNFTPLFNEFLPDHDKQYKGIIFITDGEVSTNGWDEPNCPVLWVMTQKNDWFTNRVPFGECVQMID